jgi:hypothetical protein
LQLSSKISFSDHLSPESRLAKSWGGVFYHPDFVKPACEILGLTGAPSYITSDKEKIGALNLLLGKRSVFRSATLPLLFQYFGPLFFEKSPIGETLEAFENYLSPICDYAFLSFSPDFKTLEGFSSTWKIIPNMTLVLNDDDLKKWGQGFRDDVKNKIRKASREKIEIAHSDRFPKQLWETAYSRHGITPPIDPPSLERWCQALMNASLLRIYVAKLAGAEVAFRGELIYGEFAYDWIAGSDPAFHSSGANQLLMAEIGRELSGLGLSAWDLVGGEIPSIADFKRSFGAREVPYFQASRAFGIKGKAFELLRSIKHGRK